MKHVLEVTELTKQFPTKKGVFTAVDGISFAIKPGEVLGFLGANGAGKTTTIQMLLGTTTPTGGAIEYFGQDFTRNRSEILQKVSFASSYTYLPWRLTVAENLDVFSRMIGLNAQQRKKRIEKFLRAFDSWDLKDKTFGSLSAGQKTRVQLAKAFIVHPEVCLLDEPTASLDPDIAHEVRAFVRTQQREYGVSMLYTSHNMDEVSEVCDRVIFLKKGQIIACDEPRRLAQESGLTRVSIGAVSSPQRLEEVLVANAVSFSQEAGAYELFVSHDEVGALLSELGLVGIRYEEIHIEKPTLEEYFLKISKEAA
ncbi:MAG: ABC transporter ATP-binding protein [Bdellovibrionota bacterium]